MTANYSTMTLVMLQYFCH